MNKLAIETYLLKKVMSGITKYFLVICEKSFLLMGVYKNRWNFCILYNKNITKLLEIGAIEIAK